MKGFANHFTGKQWHAPRSAFRPKAGNSTYEKRAEQRKAIAAVKAKEKEMKEEKEAERQVGCGRVRLKPLNQNNLIMAVT